MRPAHISPCPSAPSPNLSSQKPQLPCPTSLSRAGVGAREVATHRLCPLDLSLPQALWRAGQRKKPRLWSLRLQEETQGSSSRPALSPLPRAPHSQRTPQVLERGPLIGGGGLGGLGHLPARTEGSSLCERREQEAGLGVCPRALWPASSSTRGRRSQGRPLGDTLGSWLGTGSHPALLSSCRFWGWKLRPRGGGSLASDLLRAINCEAGLTTASPHGAAAGPLRSTNFNSLLDDHTK